MTEAAAHGKMPPRAGNGDEHMERQCLRCREPFPSEWIGERICARCKRSKSWRGGIPSVVQSTPRR